MLFVCYSYVILPINTCANRDHLLIITYIDVFSFLEIRCKGTQKK